MKPNPATVGAQLLQCASDSPLEDHVVPIIVVTLISAHCFELKLATGPKPAHKKNVS